MASILRRRAQASIFLNSTDEEWVSRSSARCEDAQDDALDLLAEMGHKGVTWRDIGRTLDEHHGIGEAVLKALHAEREVVRLKEGTREGAYVYVLPEFANARPVVR